MKLVITKEEMDFIKDTVREVKGEKNIFTKAFSKAFITNDTIVKYLEKHFTIGTVFTFENGDVVLSIRTEFSVKVAEKYKKYLTILIPAYKSIFMTCEAFSDEFLELVEEEEKEVSKLMKSNTIDTPEVKAADNNDAKETFESIISNLNEKVIDDIVSSAVKSANDAVMDVFDKHFNSNYCPRIILTGNGAIVESKSDMIKRFKEESSQEKPVDKTNIKLVKDVEEEEEDEYI